jgi:hypothetical protein
LAQEKDGTRSAKHNMPDSQEKPAYLPDGNEEKDKGQNDDRKIRTRLFSMRPDESWHPLARTGKEES